MVPTQLPLPAFPVQVRRYAAEQLYTSLLTFDADDWATSAGGASAASVTPDVDAAQELLSTVAWDGPLEAVRTARSQLYQCFGLPEPRLIRKAAGAGAGGQQGGQQCPGGEDVSYQSLIDRAMRGM
jgi:hypothetical protein